MPNFETCLEVLFLRHPGFHKINDVTQPALTAQLVNGLSPEISGLIKKVDHSKLWKILQEMGPDHLICLLRNLYAGKKQQLEPDMK